MPDMPPAGSTKYKSDVGPDSSITGREVVVVVGNGMVGHRFLDKMCAYDTNRRFQLVTIGEEPVEHYNRMLLTEYFEHQQLDQLKLAPGPEWYVENDITLMLQMRVMAIDPKSKVLRCQVADTRDTTHELDKREKQLVHEEVTVAYDRLVLATGSRATRPSIHGAQGPGVFVYRTIDDLTGMIAYAERQKMRDGTKSALVVGGGLLGLEAAKALRDMNIRVRVVNRGPRLMSRQLDDAGSQLLETEMRSKFGIEVLYHKTTAAIVHNTLDDEMSVGAVTAAETDSIARVDFTDGTQLDDVFMVVFTTGICPRDELAQATGIATADGVVVNDRLETTATDIYAIGECVRHRGKTYGLVAPGYEMADVLAQNLCATGCSSTNPTGMCFTGTDTATKLKLMGTEVASFGACFPDEDPTLEAFTSLVYENPLEGVYKKLVFSADGKRLLGGILVGDTCDFPRLALWHKRRHDEPLTELPGEILLSRRSNAPDGGGNSGVTSFPDAAEICSCNNVTKGALCQAIRTENLTTLAEIKKSCNAGTGCGGCLPMVKELLETELEAMGSIVDRSLCEHFAFSRQELFQIVQVEGYRSFAAVLEGHGRPPPSGSSPEQRLRLGCAICKPTIASILASLANEHVLEGDRAGLQDSNDRFLANLQKSGQFSIVPRIAGGEITPDKLIVLGQVAKSYNLYTKITGGQRVDLFGAERHQLPEIWEALVNAGFESGHAYGKALRTVKSCVGSTWCRFGVQDAVGFAIFLENRYKGIRSPHKIKGGVSGCTRECAEARSKDFGCIATERGYNIYVAGNGGTNPKHAVLLARDVPPDRTVTYLDRYLMYYIRTADRLQRTSKWLENLDGGIEQLRRVVLEDSLGICGTLEAQMQRLLNTYECEWRRVVESPALRAQFRQFQNTPATQPSVPMREERGQRIPATGRSGKNSSPSSSPPISPTSPSSASAIVSFEAEGGQHWHCVGFSRGYLANSGHAVLVGETQLAIFNISSLRNGLLTELWFATANRCPLDGALVLAQGIVGDHNGRLLITCPMHKCQFALDDGQCLSDDAGPALETFPVHERDGELLVFLPPVDVLDRRLGTNRAILKTVESHDNRGWERPRRESGAGCGVAGGCGDRRLEW